VSRGIVLQEQDPLRDLPAAFFLHRELRRAKDLTATPRALHLCINSNKGNCYHSCHDASQYPP
jgi:hypothetical protein